MTYDFSRDIAAVQKIPSVNGILREVCDLTGMRFSAVARVTTDRWIVCQVLDKIEFGLTPGGELEVATTICDEIRESGEGVIIEHVAEEPAWRTHHTPIMYGFQSYLSLPIIREDASFFGTLCAIDPDPRPGGILPFVDRIREFARAIAAELDAQIAR